MDRAHFEVSSAAPVAVHLNGVLKESAQQLLARGIEAEVRYFRDTVARNGTAKGRDPVVRNGFHPERTIVTGVGPIPVRLPKMRRRHAQSVVFRSMLLPRYSRRTQVSSRESLHFYSRAVMEGDLGQALAALVGPQAYALPQPVALQLRDWWHEQCAAWRSAFAMDRPP